MFTFNSDSRYQLLPDKNELHEEAIPGESSRQSLNKATQRRTVIIITALFVSLALNLGLLLVLLRPRFPQSLERSSFATSDTYITVPWTLHSDYFSPHIDTRIVDDTWRNIDFNAGIVALEEEEITEFGLPPSQLFPWDQSKKMYLLNGFHSLHCLKRIYASLARYRDGITFSDLEHHSFHCVDALRQDTICAADGTPRFSGMGQPQGTTGLGQKHQCRNWTRLEDWARQRTACYRFLNETVDRQSDRSKFCPDGSGYNLKLTTLYGEDYRTRLIAKYGTTAA